MRERTRSVFLALALVTSLVGPMAGCWQSPSTGPGEIHWDRQTCERCQMVISQRRHAVQVRAKGDHRAHAFDDLGCALLWLDEEGLPAGRDSGGDSLHEIWVKGPHGSEWIDG